jgi:hypothetical protein
VWLSHRFALSLRDVEELMLARGVLVTYETVRSWCAKFGPDYAAQLRRRWRRPGDKRHLADQGPGTGDETLRFARASSTVSYFRSATSDSTLCLVVI